MYQSIRGKLTRRLSGKILGISGIKNFYPMINLNKSQLKEVSYPQVDMQKLPYKNNSFDAVISDQVLEHLASPQKAIDESYRVLKKGGLAIHTTCLINPLHLPDPDYWRFSPAGLGFLCRRFSQIVDSAGWGNRLIAVANLLIPRILPKNLNLKRWIWLQKIISFNEKKYPIVCWVIAKK